MRSASVALVACGTAFHWLAPAPALAEMARVLAPGCWAALFWRYAAPGEAAMAVVTDVLRRFAPAVPGDLRFVHPPEPFAGSSLRAEAPVVLSSTLGFTTEEFHGYVATVEWLRRVAGPAHAAFLATLRVELEGRWPDGLDERHHEYLFLAQKPVPT